MINELLFEVQTTTFESFVVKFRKFLLKCLGLNWHENFSWIIVLDCVTEILHFKDFYCFYNIELIFRLVCKSYKIYNGLVSQFLSCFSDFNIENQCKRFWFFLRSENILRSKVKIDKTVYVDGSLVLLCFFAYTSVLLLFRYEWCQNALWLNAPTFMLSAVPTRHYGDADSSRGWSAPTSER